MAGIYLHIPFCKQACHYCDFHFSTDKSFTGHLVKAMSSELISRKDYFDEPVSTIYFGGGTPSLLSNFELELLLDTIHKNYSVAGDAEITLEANPDDLTLDKLIFLKGTGINRLSIGVQTFDDTLLRFLNRAHDSESAVRCLDLVRNAGFDNISVDLIYAIPGLTERLWRDSLATVLSVSPEHISSYTLTIEERTVFGNWLKRGKLHPMEEEASVRQFEILSETLSSNGYQQYEISNFSKPGFHSRHNSNYWKGALYLGVGPSAHSYNGQSRQFNIRNNAAYVRMINSGVDTFESEILTPENKINEYILTRLRTIWGCDLEFMKSEFNDDLRKRKEDHLKNLLVAGLVSIDKNVLRLTEKGKLLADKITEDLIV